MRYGYWLPVFGGWLRNVPDEGMSASWEYVKKLAQRSEQIGYDITLIAELFMNDIKGIDADSLDAGRFAWGEVQHEYAHVVDFALLDDRAQVVRLDANRFCHDYRGEPFDLVFVDPPYAFDDWEALLARLPAAFVHAIRLALADSLHDIYLFAGAILVLALISTVFMKEVPLTGDRAENGFDEVPAGEAEEEAERAVATG